MKDEGTNQKILQRIAFKAVIINSKNQVLLLREASTYDEGTNVGKYHSPGGRLEPGEAWQDGLKREVLEETGFTEFEIGQPLFVGEWRPVIKGFQNQIIALFVVCRLKQDQDPKLSDEHDAFCWLSKGEQPPNGVVMKPEDEVVETYFNLN